MTVFPEDGRSATTEKLCYIAGFLLGELRIGPIYHSLFWSSQKLKPPVRSIDGAKILAAGKAID